MANRCYRRVLHASRRSCALLALVGFLAGSIGVPVPLPTRTAKDRSQPFPCMDHACGCLSAAQCWQSCCCFTNREKLAWAAEHGVRPPAFVVAAAAIEKPKTGGGCCVAKRALATSCEQEATCCDHNDHGTVGHSSASVVTFVLAIQARKCQGQVELWLALGAVTPPPARFAVNRESPTVSEASELIATLTGISERPATPPPRA